MKPDRGPGFQVEPLWAQVVPRTSPWKRARKPGPPAEPDATGEATRHEQCVSTKGPPSPPGGPFSNLDPCLRAGHIRGGGPPLDAQDWLTEQRGPRAAHPGTDVAGARLPLASQARCRQGVRPGDLDLRGAYRARVELDPRSCRSSGRSRSPAWRARIGLPWSPTGLPPGRGGDRGRRRTQRPCAD
jgi:hypothetical protein